MSRRVTLDPTVSRFDFQRFASARGWRLHRVFAHSDEQPYEEVWMTDDRSVTARYIEDEIIAVSYVTVTGEREDGAVAELTGVLATVDPRSAARQARTAPSKETRLRGISYLAATAPKGARPELVDAFADLLADPCSEIRLGAVVAAAYPSWRELDPLLERVATADPDIHLRDAATQTLTAIRRHRNGAHR
jgi:hypothetical protein